MSALQRMIKVYDRTMRGGHQRRYYGDSGYFNFGYWATGASSQQEACDALVDRLAAGIATKQGRILDVACGLGASTRRLMQSYEPGAITAINISEQQLEAARARAPGGTFRVMDATRLDFPDDSFDAVICVEAAFHFDTRDRFLAECRRVLKPGGSLVLSDILFRRFTGALLEFGQVPRANLLPDVAAYQSRLAAAGFAAVKVEDATDACLGGFRAALRRWPAAERRAGRMKLMDSIVAGALCRAIGGYFNAFCKNYLLVSARKPAA